MAAVRSLHLERLGEDSPLDYIAQVAKDRFKVPVALVTVVGEDDQLYVGRAGTSDERGMRPGSFCDVTIRSDDLLVVEDAKLDPRFEKGPLVAGPPHVRFYAGAPIVLAPGVRIGAVCLLDMKPRAFNVGERTLLKHMALAAKAEFEKIVLERSPN